VTIAHSFTSPKADGTDGTEVQASHWNANHKSPPFVVPLIGAPLVLTDAPATATEIGASVNGGISMDRLTPRERDVLACRCRFGLTEKETAARLGISRDTVKTHGRAILRATGASAIQQACFEHAAALRRPELAEWPFGRCRTLPTKRGVVNLLMQHRAGEG
jgi:DNA-binding CsgD family transcriptional regulator